MDIVTLTTVFVPPEVGLQERDIVGGPVPSGISGDVELLLQAKRLIRKTNNWINIKRFVIRRSHCLRLSCFIGFLFRFMDILILNGL